jgi:hypothetical protein
MTKWWIVGLVVVLFIGGLAWKLMDVKTCADDGGVVVAPLTAHQNCARR